MPPLPAAYNDMRPQRGESFEQGLRRIFPTYNAAEQRAVRSSPLFTRLRLPEQIETFVHEFMPLVYALSPEQQQHVENYRVSPNMMFCRRSLGGDYTSATHPCVISVPMLPLEARPVRLQGANPQRTNHDTKGWGLSRPHEEHNGFPGPAVLPDWEGEWTEGAEAFRRGEWSDRGRRACTIDAVCPTHPDYHELIAVDKAPASRSFVAGGACRVSWQLDAPDTYLRSSFLPAFTRWNFQFDMVDSDRPQKGVETYYFAVEFSMLLQELQEIHRPGLYGGAERQRMSPLRDVRRRSLLEARELGTEHRVKSREQARRTVFWPQARQLWQW